MKKFYILTVAVLTAAGTMAAPSLPSPFSKAKKTHKTEMRKAAKKAPRLRAESRNSLWRPGTQIVSEWNPDEETWAEYAKYITTYDNAGHILTDKIVSLEGEGANLTTYEYNEYGMPVKKLVTISADGSAFVNYSNTVREYDPTVHSVIISNTESIWMDEAWQEQGNCYRRDVTRNADGNVTEVVIRTLYDGNYEATQKMTVEYGADKKAVRIVISVLDYDENGDLTMVPEMEYKDIVWHRTNGQIISDEDITSVDNGIASCTVIDIDGENYVTVEYPDDKGSFKSNLKYAMGEISVDLKMLDEYGSYDYSQEEIYREEGQEDYLYSIEERYRINEYGLETELYSAEGEGEDLEITGWMKAEIESNPEYGYPDLFTMTEYNPDEDVFDNMMQIKFEDYTDVSGVKGASDEDSQAPAEYYNLQGMRIQGEPASGIYIRRQGSEVTKILK